MGSPNSDVRRYGGKTAQERGAERRVRLEQAALELIAARGWKDATMTEICRTAGLTERYFYESFRNRDELYVALIDQLAADVLAAVFAAVDRAARPRARVAAAAQALVAFLAGDPRRGRLAFVEGTGTPALERHRRQIVLGLGDAIAARWTALFDADGGSLRQRTLLATSMTGSIAALLTRRLDGTLDITDDELAQSITEVALRLAGVPD